MNRANKPALIVTLLTMLVVQPLVALACGTCGCSELCPLTMVEDTESGGTARGLLSDSIWGSIILKMAYQRDPVLLKLTKYKRGLSGLTGGSVATAIGGTFAQGIVSVSTLNPPPGQKDSYLPGSLGLGWSGLVNVAFNAGVVVNWRLSRKIKARQLVVKNRVESILNHLENSEAACPHAQSDLAELIGERAALDCIKLWQSSHATVASSADKTLSQGNASNKSGISDLPDGQKIVSSTQLQQPSALAPTDTNP